MEDLVEARKVKLEKVRELGITPYPYNYSPNGFSDEIRQGYESGAFDHSREFRVAGRLMAYRNHGKIAFAELQDGHGRIQVYFDRAKLEPKKADLLPLLDLGDFVGVEGSVFKTKRGEVTINVRDYDLLTKTLLPLPDKWHGLQDPELKYRRRSEFFSANPELREVFVKRSKAISAMREFLDSQGFLEVETPLLQPVYGGASAKPFKTFLNSLDREYFMSISPELYLKRLVAAGFDRVYTICKNFRNEGIDRTHNPEFTMMECYQAYADYNDMMHLTENMYAFIFNKVLGTSKVKYSDPESEKGEVEIDFTPPWRRERMLDLVMKSTGIDVARSDADGLRGLIERLEPEGFFKQGIPREDLKRWSWGEMVVALFEYHCQSSLIQPTFVIDHPLETTPLCKIHRGDSRLIERFEPFVYGWEIGNAYSELNDPMRQKELLEEQVRTRTSDEIPSQIDEDFCRAIEFGIPPTGGLGLGIDRLVMLLTNSYAIKDVILFPLIKYNGEK